jgi:hypothetical protein
MIKFSPRYFLLPLIALVVIGSLPAPADSGQQGNGCASVVAVQDPDLKASFERFERSQSAAAAKVCAFFRNSAEPSVR